MSYKLTSDSVWRNTFRVDPTSTFAEVSLAAQLNTQYDLRIRAVNQLGVQSAYTILSGFYVGSSGTIGATNDWGNWTTSITASNDWGNETSTITASNDWGYYS
jgi:hypothetical protein